MANLNDIKSWFRTGKFPTESQFSQTWDSFWHKAEKISLSAVEGLSQILSSKADRDLVDRQVEDLRTNKENVGVAHDLVNAHNVAPDAHEALFALKANDADVYHRDVLDARFSRHEEDEGVHLQEGEREAWNVHKDDATLHKTSEQIRSEIVEADIPSTIARDSEVEEKLAAHNENTSAHTDIRGSIRNLEAGATVAGRSEFAAKLGTAEDSYTKAQLDEKIATCQTKTGNTGSNVTTFGEAAVRTNLVSGDTHATLFGKIKKWFTDLKPVAFSGRASDLTEDATHRFMTDTERSKFSEMETFNREYPWPQVKEAVRKSLEDFDLHDATVHVEIVDESIPASGSVTKEEGSNRARFDFKIPVPKIPDKLPLPNEIPAAIIKETNEKKFVSDLEKEKWNNRDSTYILPNGLFSLAVGTYEANNIDETIFGGLEGFLKIKEKIEKNERLIINNDVSNNLATVHSTSNVNSALVFTNLKTKIIMIGISYLIFDNINLCELHSINIVYAYSNDTYAFKSISKKVIQIS